MVRTLWWTLPRTSGELRLWRARALAAADPQLRHDSTSALKQKRVQSEGAALLSFLARRRNIDLLCLLLTYQLIWDYLDTTHEQAPGTANGLALHRALTDAFEPRRPTSDHYRLHGWQDDCGYLAALVKRCREEATRLPSFPVVQTTLIAAACLSGRILAVNHCRDPCRREAKLKACAAADPGSWSRWFEATAAASAGLTIFAALAAAVDRPDDRRAILATTELYRHHISAAATMLDSYADRSQDACSGDHVYIDYYPNLASAVRRTGEMIEASLRGAQALRRPFRHRVIVASMVAMYLTKDSSRGTASRQSTLYLAHCGGTLTRALIPVIRLWRILYALRSS